MNKHTILAIVTFLTGISLSVAAAYYSIIGLTAIFPGQFWPIVYMGAVLEVAKLVSISWLYHNWKSSPFLIKSFLVLSSIILIFITSIGVFGFLSKAHIEQQLTLSTGVVDQISILDLKIKTKEDEIVDTDKQILVIDDAIAKLTDRGQARTALTESKKQRQEREKLITKKSEIIDTIAPLKEEKITLESNIKKLEAEVGPIKYVAELIYGETSEKILDKSVRIVIILLIVVFDPLAILLLLAFNISLTKREYNMEFLTLDNKTVTKKRQKKEPAISGGTF